MSKTEVVEILKALGGSGTRKQIHSKAMEMYPSYPALKNYTEVALSRLRKWGDVTWNNGVWTLVPEPETVVVEQGK